MTRERDQLPATPRDEQVGWLCHVADGSRHFIWKDRNEAEEMAWIKKRYVRWEPLFVRSESGDMTREAALIRDAARYRFLRDCCKFLEIITMADQMFRVSGGNNLDKTIDAAARP